MNDRIDAIVVQCLAKLVCFKKVAFNKTGAVNNGAAMAFGEIVVDHNFVAVVDQFFRDYTADVSCAARYENPHDLPLDFFSLTDSNIGLCLRRVRLNRLGRCDVKNTTTVIKRDELNSTPEIGNNLWPQRHETRTARTIARLRNCDAISDPRSDSR